MKVTALLDDKLIEEVKEYSGGRNITESLLIALNYFVSKKKQERAFDEIESEPLQFREDFVVYQNRKLNRDR